MKILTIICNVALFGIAFIALLTRGNSSEPLNLVFAFLLLLVPILNIVFMLGSRVNYSQLPFNVKIKTSQQQSETGNTSSGYLIVKIIAIILNLVIVVLLYREFVNKYPNPLNFIVTTFALFVIITPIFSLITILISSANKFKDLKRTIIITGTIVGALLFCFFLVMRIWIGQGIKERISIAKQQYSGIAEDALIAYMEDSNHTPRERTDVAVWTLGQIRSQKALPLLKKLYTGEPCHHNTELCQYEIHKAIVNIERNWLGAKEKNLFGSWARLNK